MATDEDNVTEDDEEIENEAQNEKIAEPPSIPIEKTEYISKYVLIFLLLTIASVSTEEPNIKDRERKGLFISDLLLCIVESEHERDEIVLSPETEND